MSSVIVQIGQCGNQVGHQLWKYLLKHKDCNESLVYVNGDGRLRTIHVDSEPKVLAQLRRDFPSSVFRDENILVGRRGRGTNWALGYNGTKQHAEDGILEDTMEALRKETERCSSFSGVIFMHSLSGGTGSGLGSHLTELVREEYPLNYIMSCVVAPHLAGESPLQHYNSLLCLSWLQRFSDSVLLFHNDEILYRMEKRLQQSRAAAQAAESEAPAAGVGVPQQPGVSFLSMNKHIGQCLAGLFLPTDTLNTSSGYSTGPEPWELLRSVTPMPNTKFIHVNHHAKSKQSWENIAGQMLYNIQKHSTDGKPYKSIANLVVARGDTTGSFPAAMAKIESRVKSAYHCVEWNPFPVDFWTAKSTTTGIKDVASVTMAANYSNVVDYLDHVNERANQKYAARAYLHWYEKYGCDKTMFEEAFEVIQSTVEEYRNAVT